MQPTNVVRGASTNLPPTISRYLPHPSTGGLAAAELNRLTQQPTQKLIIILRDQHENLPALGAAAAARAAAIGGEQAPLLRELARAQATNVTPFTLINAIAATVPSAAVPRLAADPAVRAVVPDLSLPLPRLPSLPKRANATPAALPGSGAAPASCSQQPLLEPEALQITQAAFSDPTIPQAQNIATGKGVTVAVIGFPFDPNNPDLIRPDGSHVVVSYQDFGGLGPGAPLPASGEGFGDATDVAAQGRVTYNLNDFINSYYTTPGSCPQLIKIRGMAPGASLIGAVYVGPDFTFSTAAEDIQYAATHGANVLSESFIINRYPDDVNNPINLANDAAVRAGVTVVGSTGDAGSVNTIGNPETDPNIIAVGATTSFRIYQQAHFFSVPGASGYVDDNMSSFSSGGFSQADVASPHGPRVPDVVAPGDLGWALCSPNVAVYADCRDLNGKPSSIEIFGGTSMAAPLTAGEAALVIQAYRDTHGGASPTPDLVKQIIMNTATDLHTPGDQQGAGLINALKAVELARAIQTPARSSTTDSLLSVSPTSFAAAAAPNTPESFTVSVTNNGRLTQVVKPQLVGDSGPLSSATYTLSLDPAHDPSFPGIVGQPLAYRVQDVNVPPGAQRLYAAIAYNIVAQPSTLVQLLLYDQLNRLVAYSNPQGISGFGSVTVHDPSAGVYHAYLVTDAAPFGYAGPVQLSVSTSRDAPAGRVNPSLQLVLPGRTVQFTVTTSTPAQPGDLSERLVFTNVYGFELPGISPFAGLAGSVPVALRSYVPLGPTGGAITGILTGGNGRAGNNAQPIQTYEFNVPAGLSDLDLSFGIGDPDYNLSGYLIDPSGIQRDIQSTVTAVDTNPTLPNGQPNPDYGLPTAFTNAMQFFVARPQPGLWRFVLGIDITISGRQTAEPFTATITFNGAQVQPQAPVPNSPSTVLKRGKSMTIPIRITNNGSTPKMLFVDPRLAGTTTTYDLGGPTDGPLPGVIPVYLVPTHSTNIFSVAESHDPTVPTSLDLYNASGEPLIDPQNAVTLSPDVAGRQGADPFTGNFIAFVESGSQTADGAWVSVPAQVGPFPVGGEQPSLVDMDTAVTTQAFDAQAVPDTGDLMAVIAGQADPFSYNPLVLTPGQSGVIDVAITPSAPVGTVVSGVLYVAAFNGIPLSTDELRAIPYTYRVG